jgi:predicted nucleic acid-binding protein
VKIEKAVVNASPLILLFKSGRADLLPQLFAEVVVPEAVWEEVMAGGESDIAAAGMSSAGWIQRVKIPTIAPEVTVWNLGDGESEVLTFALTYSDYRAVIDDHAARSCARTLGVRTLGTGGALILAKRRGLVSSLSVELEILRDAGLWLSEEIVALLKEQAGETDSD